MTGSVHSICLALLVAIGLAGCGKSADDKRTDAGHTYCDRLQAKGLLLEPMSACLKEYADATKEP